jgi:cytochrome c553
MTDSKNVIRGKTVIRAKSMIMGTALVAAALPAFGGGDPAAGQAKAQVCAACHGTTGVSKYETAQAPIIGGQYADYIVRALKDYKSGKRENAVMKGLAANLSEQDMEDIAAYFARQDGLDAPQISNY